MTRKNPYRERTLPFWLKETLAVIGCVAIVVFLIQVAPMILEGLAR